MKSRLFLSVLAVSVLALSGCYINLTATTRINDDGSGFRITTYSADGATEKEELSKYYALPAGGSWKLESYAKGNPPNHIYEVKRLFTDITGLGPDYVRRGKNPRNISDNKYSLHIHNGILYTTYEYEEVYRDCATPEKVRSYCEQLYDDTIEMAAREVEKAFPKAIKKQEVKSALDIRYRPYFSYFLKEFLMKGRKAFESEDAVFKSKMAEYEEKYSAEDFSDFLASYIVASDRDADRKKVIAKLIEVHEKIDEALSQRGTVLNEANYDDAFGVYAWPIFMGYPFDISVILPGTVIEANAKEIKGNAAVWEFTYDDFFLKEKKLFAKSRKLNKTGIGLLAVLSIAVLYAARARQAKKK